MSNYIYNDRYDDNPKYESAEFLAWNLGFRFGLTYSCQVNLEGTINNMLQEGLTMEKIDEILSDVLENVDFVYYDSISPC